VGDLSEKSKPDRLGPRWIHCKTCPPLPGPGRLGRRPQGARRETGLDNGQFR
jgi:hypothetical protein